MKERYIEHRFSADLLEVIKTANEIIEEYQAQGFCLTLRQLYYQFVSRGLIPNNMREYKKLGDVINNARLAGLVDWEAIEDRTRDLRSLPSWEDPAEIVGACAAQFHLDLWAQQPTRVEVWIEKDALLGVIERVCNENSVSYFSCRGYVSQSEMWVAAKRIWKYLKEGQEFLLLHLGDHDPSGLDMTRDIHDRLAMFLRGSEIEVRRIALTEEQIAEYTPPPNPAKLTDARAEAYIAAHGEESWELDALDPKMLHDLIEGHIVKERDEEQWARDCDEQQECRDELRLVASGWNKAVKAVKK